MTLGGVSRDTKCRLKISNFSHEGDVITIFLTTSRSTHHRRHSNKTVARRGQCGHWPLSIDRYPSQSSQFALFSLTFSLSSSSQHYLEGSLSIHCIPIGSILRILSNHNNTVQKKNAPYFLVVFLPPGGTFFGFLVVVASYQNIARPVPTRKRSFRSPPHCAPRFFGRSAES